MEARNVHMRENVKKLGGYLSSNGEEDPSLISIVWLLEASYLYHHGYLLGSRDYGSRRLGE